jgi:hypothetical protein
MQRMDTLRQCITAALAGNGSAPPLVVCVCRDRSREPGDWADRLTASEWPRQYVHDDGLSWAGSPPPNQRILLLAPFASTRELGVDAESLREDGWRISPSLAAVLLLKATRHASPGQRIAALAPSNAFASPYSEPRYRLLEVANVHLVAESDGDWAQALGLHAAFRLSLFCFERRAGDEPFGVSRFLRVPRGANSEALTQELKLLLRQGGGRTHHGYVEREALDAARPLQYAAFDPLRKERQSALRSIGEVRLLGDLVTIAPGTVSRTIHANDLGETGVPVLTGKALRAPSLGDIGLSCIKNPDERAHLRAGDICVAAITMPGQRLRVRRISAADLPLVADAHLLVLRPADFLIDEQVAFLVDYLQSERAAALLTHETTGGPHLRVDQLRQLAVPLPDDTLLSAVHDLRDTQRQLNAWASEVDEAVSGILGDTTDDGGVLRLRSEGQLLRQRVAAARQLDDLGYRVRNLFPFPIALPWRRAMTASRDLEGYQGTLECAESLTVYLAILGVLLARQLSHELGSVQSLCDKLAGTSHGASIGDWTAIVREVAGKNLQKKASATTPLIELTELMVDGTAASEALEDLTEMRNDLAHGRGPKGHLIRAAFDDASAALVQLYDACQWLCDYPVRLVEETSWDSYAELGRYTYRELVGDHYLVPQRVGTIDVPTLNAGRLYLADRNGQLHLMSPLVLWHECDTCHLPSAFFLDNYDRRTGECRMRAMDHNHTIRRRDVAGPFAALGLLPG